MKKPSHQWETRRAQAIRRADSPAGEWAKDARAEAFDLLSDEAESGEVICGLESQRADSLASDDPGVPFAVAAWLVARGARGSNLRGPGGQLHAEALSPAGLSDGPPAATPRRLVSLCPSNAEMIEALGCFDRVVACEDSSDWPKAVEDLERLGPDLAPDLDRVAALEPDLVISSLTVPGMERVVTGLRARRIPQLVLAPRSLADVLAEVELVGKYLHVESAADALQTKMRAEIDQLEASLSGEPTPVYVEWWPRPMFTPGADCYSNELIRLAGGVNVFGDRSGSSIEIQAQELVDRNPTVCFVSWCGVKAGKLDPQNLVQRPGLERLQAAREGRVFRLDEAYSGRPGPRMLEASRIMARAIESVRAHAD